MRSTPTAPVGQPLSRQERQRRSLDDVPLQFRTNRIDQLTESITSRLRKVKPSVEPPTKKARASEALNVSLEFDAETLDSEPGVKLQEVFLTGKAAQKEIKYCDLSPPQRVLMLKAMAKEWDKWTEFKASRFLTESELKQILKRNPHQKIVGTRWVLTPKGADYKARLVVQGCQEDKTLYQV